MNIITGTLPEPLKVLIYGPEGIGKTTLAAQFPNPLFLDTEGSTARMDVRRLPYPLNWTELLDELDWAYDHHGEFGTLVLDTADWAETMCIEHVCAREHKANIEAFGYGKGYSYVAQEFGRLLDKLNQVRAKGAHTVVVAHAKMRKFELPEEMGAYDRWELDLCRQVAPMLKEWSDMTLFAAYRMLVVNVDGQGAQKGRNKVQGGARVLRTTHHPCWDAKNRFGLPEELPLEYASIRSAVEGAPCEPQAPAPAPTPAAPAPTPAPTPAPAQPGQPHPEWTQQIERMNPRESIPAELLALMDADGIAAEELVYTVAKKGHYPAGTPIARYDPAYIQNLARVWPQVRAEIMADRKSVPF